MFHDSCCPYCDCQNGNTETCFNFSLLCSDFFDERLVLLSSLSNIDATIFRENDTNLTHVLLFADPPFDKNINALNLEATVDYLVVTGRFDEP